MSTLNIQDEIMSLNENSIIILKSSDPKKFVVGGYASVPIIDSEKERIRPEAMDQAFKLLMKRVSRRNYMLHHSNIQIGELLWNYRDNQGNTFKSGLDYDGKLNEQALRSYNLKPKQGGLFVLCDVFVDTDSGREAIEEMKKGRLLSFSIGGKILPNGRETKCSNGRCWDNIVKLELSEVTSCNEGVNSEAEAFILKSKVEPCLKPSEEPPTCTNASWGCQNCIKLYKQKPSSIEGTNKNTVGEGTKMTDDLIDEQTFGERLDKLEKAVSKPKTVTKYFFGKPKKDNFEKEEDYQIQLGAYWATREAVDSEIDKSMESIPDIEKESYKEFMGACMRDGGSMKECA
ncbi:HK97 family phage prohead protease, partial [Candidatus Bathyarchaeota archaeon]|nr:HK97 family phage prohead protease [Candidatus Bathyarchaeota archaeon]